MTLRAVSSGLIRGLGSMSPKQIPLPGTFRSLDHFMRKIPFDVGCMSHPLIETMEDLKGDIAKAKEKFEDEQSLVPHVEAKDSQPKNHKGSKRSRSKNAKKEKPEKQEKKAKKETAKKEPRAPSMKAASSTMAPLEENPTMEEIEALLELENEEVETVDTDRDEELEVVCATPAPTLTPEVCRKPRTTQYWGGHLGTS